MTDPLPPFTGDNPTCAQCGHRGAATEYRPHGHCMHPTDAVMGFDPNPRLHRTCCRCGHVWDEATVEQAREDGQNAATGATETPGDPEADETPTGRQAGAQDRDEWTRALEQVQHLQRARKSDGKEIARLEAELVQARAVVDRVTAAQLALRCADDRRTIRNALNPADDPQTCHSGVVCTPASRCADHADQEARP